MTDDERNPLQEAVEKALERQDQSGKEWIDSVLASSPTEADAASDNGSEPLMDSVEKALRRQGRFDLNQVEGELL